MANFYYVKSGGSRASGGYTSIQSISSAIMTSANYYDNINAVHAGNTLNEGDMVLCFDLHSYNYAVTTIIDFKDNVKYISVDDADGSVYKAGASEEATGGVYDLTLDSINDSYITIEGISFRSGDDLLLGYGFNSVFRYKDLTLSLDGSGVSDKMTITQGAGFQLFDNVVFNLTTYGQYINIFGTGISHFNNVIFTGDTSKLFKVSGADGGIIHAQNVDFSSITGTIVDAASAAAGDVVLFSFDRCLFNASAILNEDNSTFYEAQELKFSSINRGVDNDSWYAFEVHQVGGIVRESVSVVRTGGSAYDEVNGFSAEFKNTENTREDDRPLAFEDIHATVDLTSGATLTFHVIQQDPSSTPADLNNGQFWIDVIHPDTTDLAKGVTVSSRKENYLATTTTLSASTETWSSSGNTKKQKISLVLPVVNMEKAPIQIKMFFAKNLSVSDINGAGSIEFFADLDPVVT